MVFVEVLKLIVKLCLSVHTELRITISPALHTSGGG